MRPGFKVSKVFEVGEEGGNGFLSKRDGQHEGTR